MIVACVKVGSRYGPEYVHRLAAMVARHTTRPYRVLCLTDDPTGVAVETAPIGTDLPGWWAKLVLFQPHPALAGERVLYLDLDTVIVGSLDPLLAYDGPFAILRDFWGPAYNSSVMSLAPGVGAHVWRRFQEDPAGIMRALHGDQDWITTQLPGADTWQRIAPGVIGSYKADHLATGPGDYALICFHGYPKPPDLPPDSWARRAWEAAA